MSQTMLDGSSHSHADGKCPAADIFGPNRHAFCPPQDGDLRSPCPAVNTMANHGYIPRDGKHLNADIIIPALMECYNISKPFALVLTYGSLHLLQQGTKEFSLHDLARHGYIEHNASLCHADAGPGEEYAPVHPDLKMMQEFFADSAGGLVMNTEDVARARVRRESSYPGGSGLDLNHAVIACGEISAVLNIFNHPDPQLVARGVPLQPPSTFSWLFGLLGLARSPDPEITPTDGVSINVLRRWLQEERLPEGWKPYHETTLRSILLTTNKMRSIMRKLRAEASVDEVNPSSTTIASGVSAGIAATKDETSSSTGTVS
ncbi:hypothetical protein PHLCEN_2v4261 [Hermanssonia centrifuga]|uniref:Heme haloperoxidase family profile domain-containing protein n=1 Tax=Hermanssonia centrifuga TaxID=98765 RepID=A0A2R6PVP0_9APHY|nr:hypothetical protein PHLCEN_2v4261 [Hermanssonia centrifuga]